LQIALAASSKVAAHFGNDLMLRIAARPMRRDLFVAQWKIADFNVLLDTSVEVCYIYCLGELPRSCWLQANDMDPGQKAGELKAFLNPEDRFRAKPGWIKQQK
jgi:hypothetical protein